MRTIVGLVNFMVLVKDGVSMFVKILSFMKELTAKGMYWVRVTESLKQALLVQRMNRARARAIIRKEVAVWLPAGLARQERRARVKILD